MVTYYKQSSVQNIPTGSSEEFKTRFKDFFSNNSWAKNQKISPWMTNGTRGESGNFPAFNFNQMSLGDFFTKVVQNAGDNTYKDMMERIGRTLIWADDIADNGFLKFMKDPLEYGSAIEQAAFDDISSRPWLKNYQSTDSSTPNPLFKTQIPKYLNEVATVNFSREIPLKMSEIEFRKCCQTANTVGDVAGALIGKINVTFLDDMYEACKQYFCGCLRIAPEVTSSTAEEMPIIRNQISNNKMIEVIDYTDTEKKDGTLEDKILDKIHEITDSEFFYKSRLYNPAGRNTLSKQMTLIMPKKWNYQVFLRKFAATFHPEYIKLGEDVKPLFIDAMPELTFGFLGTATGIKDPNYEYFGILVDDRALGITPLNGGFSIDTFYNPSELSTSYFGHYEIIFSFASLFNRKYIFLHKTTTSTQGSD